MFQIFSKTLFDIKHLFDGDNFSWFFTGSLLSIITFTGMEQYIVDTSLKILTACLIAFSGGVIGVLGKEVGEKLKKEYKKWKK